MSLYFPTPAECGQHTIFGTVPIRTLTGDNLQLSLVTIPADAAIGLHAHENEQMGMVVSGTALFIVGGERQELSAGDFYRIPGHVPHEVHPIGGPVTALDVFYPIRDEYR